MHPILLAVNAAIAAFGFHTSVTRLLRPTSFFDVKWPLTAGKGVLAGALYPFTGDLGWTWIDGSPWA